MRSTSSKSWTLAPGNTKMTRLARDRWCCFRFGVKTSAGSGDSFSCPPSQAPRRQFRHSDVLTLNHTVAQSWSESRPVRWRRHFASRWPPTPIASKTETHSLPHDYVTVTFLAVSAWRRRADKRGGFATQSTGYPCHDRAADPRRDPGISGTARKCAVAALSGAALMPAPPTAG